MSPSLSLRRSLLHRVRAYPPEEVTTRNPEEVSPEAVGLSRRDVDRIWNAAVRYYRVGIQPALSVCMRRRGRVFLDRAIGHARGNGPEDPPGTPEVPATPETLFNFFSGSKAVTAMLMHLLDEQGRLRLDDAVAEYIPEFVRHGKEGITIRHVLNHRAGIPGLPPDAIDLDLLADPEKIIEVLCDARPEAKPGRDLAYHAITGGFLLAEICRRVTGKDLRTYLDEQVREPLGFRHMSYGVDRADLPRVARESFTGLPPVFPFSRVVRRALGLSLQEVVQMANDERFLTGVVPSGNIIGTANEISRFFELLVRGGELDGVRVFDRRTVVRAVIEQSYHEMDRIIMLPVRYGVGFMLGSEKLSFYGPDTPRAFGHIGFTNVIAWADPERDISVAIMNNGKPLVTPGVLLWLEIMRVIARSVPRDSCAEWSECFR
jgi:CubicO group peptidase (beta-lactamase class C family)